MRPLDSFLEAVDCQNAAAFLDEAAMFVIRSGHNPFRTRATINCGATSGPAEPSAGENIVEWRARRVGSPYSMCGPWARPARGALVRPFECLRCANGRSGSGGVAAAG
jgi:hypothetical protein